MHDTVSGARSSVGWLSRSVLVVVWIAVGLGCAAADRASAPAPTERAVGARHYHDVSLSELMQYPRAFDGDWVRVEGLAQLQFELTALSIDAQPDPNHSRALWLQLGWPISPSLSLLNASRVVVEARFDATERGHAGLFRGALVDIRAMWQPGREADAFEPRYETRVDALDQLEHKTGWVWLGIFEEGGRVYAGDGTTATPIPSRGDRIRTSRRMRIYLLDFGTTGEARRAEPPTTANEDATRFWIAPGARAVVEQVHISATPAREVWARLSTGMQPPRR